MKTTKKKEHAFSLYRKKEQIKSPLHRIRKKVWLAEKASRSIWLIVSTGNFYKSFNLCSPQRQFAISPTTTVLRWSFRTSRKEPPRILIAGGLERPESTETWNWKRFGLSDRARLLECWTTGDSCAEQIARIKWVQPRRRPRHWQRQWLTMVHKWNLVVQ